MNRLTLKDIEKIKEMPYGNIIQNGTIRQMIFELDQYKQIEEELGIDLITIFKAFRNGIYYKTKEQQGIYPQNPIEWTISMRFDYRLCRLYVEEDTYFHLQDYGKTWALTKEELMNNE